MIYDERAFDQANTTRDYLYKSLDTGKKDAPHKTIASAAQKYITPIHQLLVACRVQPENARLDGKLRVWEDCLKKICQRGVRNDVHMNS